ncbi:hypothetical protein EHQ24_08145 [Leptospira noumeaensis]|uniref:Uncharacterized protein n=1 Tax=Leptospira noumeaensis TaxID=2484964 RepID=A0A4R9IB25_9LEPT|nr:hypothetical protein [Leptospira noumeaensis]TGK82983.1 hypothetical protein EHQ24_08145 [Leptospira noumeaensis]
MKIINKSKYTKNKQILEDISKEYIELLTENIQFKKRNLDYKEVDYKDLIVAHEDFKKRNSVKSIQKERKSNLLLFTGMLYVVIGLLTYSYSNFEIGPNNLGIIISIFGIIIAFSSVTLNFLKNDIFLLTSKRIEKKIDKFEIINKWNKIETLTNAFLYNKKIAKSVENNIHLPLSKKINILYENQYINKEDIINYQTILKARNNIVHSSNLDIDEKELRNLLEKADNIIEILEIKNR